MPRKKPIPKRCSTAGTGPIKPDTPAYRLMAAVVKEIVDDLIRRSASQAGGGMDRESGAELTMSRRSAKSRPATA
jgi:hypothetical protein